MAGTTRNLDHVQDFADQKRKLSHIRRLASMGHVGGSEFPSTPWMPLELEPPFDGWPGAEWRLFGDMVQFRGEVLGSDDPALLATLPAEIRPPSTTWVHGADSATGEAMAIQIDPTGDMTVPRGGIFLSPATYALA